MYICLFLLLSIVNALKVVDHNACTTLQNLLTTNTSRSWGPSGTKKEVDITSDMRMATSVQLKVSDIDICGSLDSNQQTCCATDVGPNRYEYLTDLMQNQWHKFFINIQPFNMDAHILSERATETTGPTADEQVLNMIVTYIRSRRLDVDEETATNNLIAGVGDIYGDIISDDLQQQFCDSAGLSSDVCPCQSSNNNKWVRAIAATETVKSEAAVICSPLAHVSESLFQIQRAVDNIVEIIGLVDEYELGTTCAMAGMAILNCQLCYGMQTKKPCHGLCYSMFWSCYGTLIDAVSARWKETLTRINDITNNIENSVEIEVPNVCLLCNDYSTIASNVNTGINGCGEQVVNLDAFCDIGCNPTRRSVLSDAVRRAIGSSKNFITETTMNIFRGMHTNVCITKLGNYFDDPDTTFPTCWPGAIDILDNNLIEFEESLDPANWGGDSELTDVFSSIVRGNSYNSAIPQATEISHYLQDSSTDETSKFFFFSFFLFRYE